ncbi:MAG TPA: rod shape-determining protein RodA [Solirubrobacterales bacterium]|jgi:rod shape determining protein RodA|nr:rod shape-determining protein RodA [Solirubrobacterales bacterium]
MEAAKPSLTIAPQRSRVVEVLNLRNLDGIMLAAAVGLIAFSVFTLQSASRNEVAADPLYFVVRQSFYGVLGIALMIAVSHIDYTRLRELRVSIYAFVVGSIAFVLLVGTAIRGSNRWIELPFFQFQPSELAKVLLCVSLSAFVYERIRRPFGLTTTLTLLGLGLLPAGLVFLQPDLGTGIVLVAITLTILFVAGIPWQHFAALGAAIALLAGAAYVGGSAAGVQFLQGYQQDRLTSFLHPSNDPKDGSYQVNQAIIAVGSGERAGRGDDATQTELLFLPERHTDFIFAVIGERFGFLGAAFVVFLYALLFWRAIRVMRIATSYYGVIIAGGIVAMLAFQAIINVGMNLGLMPVTGITLPLISYGGSSVLGTFLALGLLQAIHARYARGLR